VRGSAALGLVLLFRFGVRLPGEVGLLGLVRVRLAGAVEELGLLLLLRPRLAGAVVVEELGLLFLLRGSAFKYYEVNAKLFLNQL
jgi:hypothetical protein